MTIREMTAREAWEYFRDLGQRGMLAIDEDVKGWVGFNTDDQGLYVHSIYCNDEGVACASLIQSLIALAKDLRLDSIRFIVEHDNPHFLRFVDTNRAAIQSYVVTYPICNKEKL